MKLKKITVFLLCFILAFTSVMPVGNAYGFIKIADMENGEEVSQLYDAIIDYIVENYKYDVTRDDLLTAAVTEFLKSHPEYFNEMGKAAFKALDENSSFYTYEEYTDVYADVSGIYVGIGIYVSQEGTKIVLGEPIEGSPADGSGLQVGDIITAVDDVPVTDFALDRVTSMIKGVPGTEVKITVLRNDIEYSYTLTRAEIRINPVTYNIIEETDIGYAKISSFNANTIVAFDEAMKYFAENGIEKIVLDLRNNLGGYLDAAIAVASYFVPDSKLVVIKEGKTEDDNVYYYANETENKFKAVVLINQYSASASEVVSSILRDYGTGTLVGKRSYGKGTVQEVNQVIRSGHFLWMTKAEYYTPSHTKIHKTGLEPDHYVTNTTEKFDMNSITSYDILRVLKVGDTGEDVRAVKERMKILGYQLTVDDVYDNATAAAVESFQKATELFPYGVADITTQVKINDVLADSDVVVDKQYERAVELAKRLK